MEKERDSGSKRPAWPNTVRTRAELDEALEAGLSSGTSARSFDEIVEDAIKTAEHA